MYSEREERCVLFPRSLLAPSALVMPTARRGLTGLGFCGLGVGIRESSMILSVKKSSLGRFLSDGAREPWRGLAMSGLFSLFRDAMSRRVACVEYFVVACYRIRDEGKIERNVIRD